MKSSFAPTRAFILKAEAGYSDDPSDAGNWTGGRVSYGRLIGSNKGISAVLLQQYLGRNASVQDVRDVSDETQSAIFGALFWNTLNGNEVPVGLDLMAADHGYNRGSVTAAKLLQRLVGAMPDGHIGEVTVATLCSVSPCTLLAQSTMLDVETLQSAIGVEADGDFGPVSKAAFLALDQPTALLRAFQAARAKDYKSLHNERCQHGWLNRVAAATTAALILT